MPRNSNAVLHAACAVRILILELRGGRNRILDVASSIVAVMTATGLDVGLLLNVHITVLLHIIAVKALLCA